MLMGQHGAPAVLPAACRRDTNDTAGSCQTSTRRKALPAATRSCAPPMPSAGVCQWRAMEYSDERRLHSTYCANTCHSATLGVV